METRVDNSTTFDLDDLDLTHCVIGTDLVARFDGSVTLFRRHGRRVELFGVFDGPVSAFAAIDTLDAPERQPYAASSSSSVSARCWCDGQ
jgi:hypothetical protein